MIKNRAPSTYARLGFVALFVLQAHILAFVPEYKSAFCHVDRFIDKKFDTIRPAQIHQSAPSDYTVLDEDDDQDFIENGNTMPDYEVLEDEEEDHEDNPTIARLKRPQSQTKVDTTVKATSWMEKNKRFPSSDYRENLQARRKPKQAQSKGKFDKKEGNRSFRDDFRGTRVFVQGLNPDTSWQDLKDHFRMAGEVVFASISLDGSTGESKGCGVVQFETFAQAQNAIKIMRDHPLDGATLFVREDVQEKAQMPRGGGNTTPPTKWKCANEANAEMLTQEERSTILSIIKARDQARRRRNYDASDDMRDELKYEFGVHLDDRLKLWWTDVNGKPPEMISDIKGDGRWGAQKAWRQIPTTPENDACVNPDMVEGLLKQRDIARREKDFHTADRLLEEARNAPDGDLYLRIHDESRTWRIWTDAPPPRPVQPGHGDMRKNAAEQCIELVSQHAPSKVAEVQTMLRKFPGREYNILKKLKQRYNER